MIVYAVEVAFTARLDIEPLETQPGDVIKFSVVRYNAGSGYNASTGIFTTPSNGTYEFTLITANHVANALLRTDLMRGNSATPAELYHGYYN